MKAYEARERDSPHVRAPATWRSIVTADIVDQPQPASCRSTSQVDDASQRLDSTIRGILPAFSLLFYGVGRVPPSSKGRQFFLSLSLSVHTVRFSFSFFHLRDSPSEIRETWRRVGREEERKKVGRGASCNSCPHGRRVNKKA